MTLGFGESQVKGCPVKGSISLESQRCGFISNEGSPERLEAISSPSEVKLQLPEAHLSFPEVKLLLPKMKLPAVEAYLPERRKTLETLEVQLPPLEERLPAQKVRLHLSEAQPIGETHTAAAS